MRTLIAAGGTGGHVYPALAIAEALVQIQPDNQLTFVGSVGGFERPLIAESSLTFAHTAEVQAGPLNGVGVLRGAFSAVKIAVGVAQAIAVIRRTRPDVALLTGGWVCVPSGIAAWLMRVPSMIYLPDIEPALTLQALKHLAKRAAMTAPESRRYFKADQAIVTGYPLRTAVTSATRAAGIAHFRLDESRRMLLVFGGSRGARTINRALTTALPDLLADGVQVIHITGTLDWDDARAAASAQGITVPTDGGLDGAGRGYQAYPYLHDAMGLALACADLAVCRSGASVLGELPYFGVPSVLVPYPFAWRYQKVNADYLAARGAAVVLNDDEMAAALIPTVRGILNDEARRAAMADAARKLAQPDAAAQAARALIDLAEGK